MAGRSLAILVLDTNYWPAIRREIARVAEVLKSLSPGDIVELDITRFERSIGAPPLPAA